MKIVNCSDFFLKIELVRLCLFITYLSLIAGTQEQTKDPVESKQPQENRHYKFSANSAAVNCHKFIHYATSFSCPAFLNFLDPL